MKAKKTAPVKAEQAKGLSADGQDRGAFAGLPSPKELRQAELDRKEAARWKAQLKEAFAAPLIGKPHMLSEQFLRFFDQPKVEPLLALWGWLDVAALQHGEVQMPGIGFFRLLPEIVSKHVSMMGREQPQSANGRWKCTRGMLKMIRRDGRKESKPERSLKGFVERMLPLTVPKQSDLPLSNLAFKAAMRLATPARADKVKAAMETATSDKDQERLAKRLLAIKESLQAKALLPDLNEFLKMGDASDARADKIRGEIEAATVDRIKAILAKKLRDIEGLLRAKALLPIGKVSGAIIALCELVRADKIDCECLRLLLRDESPKIRQVALIALRAELAAQRDEHRKLSVPQIKARLALRTFLCSLGDPDLINQANKQWEWLDEPSLAEDLANEVRINNKERTAKRRKSA